MILPNREQLSTESDVEQKLILPLLKEVLGFNAEEIKTKEYLVPTDIDKGAGKKLGYYPDYVVYLAGIPVLVIEAKDPSVGVDVGYREARLYAVEINKRYREGVNPIHRVLSSNGLRLVFSPWDSEKEITEISIDDLLEGSRFIDVLRAECSRKVLMAEFGIKPYTFRHRMGTVFYGSPLHGLRFPSAPKAWPWRDQVRQTHTG